MLTRLGLNAATEAVYRGLLQYPQDGVLDLAGRLGLAEAETRSALDQLSRLALVRTSADDPGQLRAVGPRLAMEVLLARQQADLAAQQQRVEAARVAAAELIAEYSQGGAHSPAGIEYLEGIESIREHLEMLNGQVRREFLTFAPGGPQTPENMKASRPLNERLLGRGVRMRTIYLDSIRRDGPTLEHARWLTELGAQVRTVATLPNRVIIYDREIALIAANSDDTAAGAVVVHSPGMIALLCALFDTLWQSAEPVGACLPRSPQELTKQEMETLRLMAQGRTDDSIAKSLGVSSRTVRRTVTSLLARLEARSRLQAGVHAVQRGYLPHLPE
ncbi:LuxR C-terminal-related transcriptional regulator [Streptomyces sp. NPDC048507]|uniref:LuxR C-terminal-related transcriptional regulator n=1 Tax=Streptomyces sp. NPDC048507 TaxID=3365560 RepID=UPI0037205188